jgi:DNA end-binding protein Ku
MPKRKASEAPPSMSTTAPREEAPKAKGKMPHKTWSGMLTLSAITIPVLMYTAAREEKVEFHHYHGECLGRVKQLGNFCSVCTQAEDPDALDPDVKLSEVMLPKDSIVRGYEYGETEVVLVTDEDVESCKPDSAKVMEILKFVPVAKVDPVYLQSSFYLAADQKGGGQRGYAIVRAALKASGTAAIAKVVKSKREEMAFILPYDPNGMVVYTSFMADEVRPMVFPDLPAFRPEELKIALQLVDALTGEWAPQEYSDSYRENVMALIEAKRGKSELPAIPHKQPSRVTADYMSAFEATLALVKKGQSKARRSA